MFQDSRFLFSKSKSLNPPVLNQEESKLVNEKLKEMLLKGAIQLVSPCKNQYLSNFFLVSKKDGGSRPVTNLKHNFFFIPAFENGGTEFITKYAPEGRLHVQAAPKRYLLLCSIKKGIKKIHKVSVGKNTLGKMCTFVIH